MGRADALGGRVRVKHARHKEEVRLIEQWAWHDSASLCVRACMYVCLPALVLACVCVLLAVDLSKGRKQSAYIINH